MAWMLFCLLCFFAIYNPVHNQRQPGRHDCDQYRFVIHNDTTNITTGVLTSYNYPFNYGKTEKCTYTFLVHLNSDEPIPDSDRDSSERNPTDLHICFRFRRFNFAGIAVGFGGSYMVDTVPRYSNQGRLSNEGDVPDAPLSVWAENFCWKFDRNNRFVITTEPSEIVPDGEYLWRGSGFYAEYDISHQVPDPFGNEEAPCGDLFTDDWYKCFADGGLLCVGEQNTCNEDEDDAPIPIQCQEKEELSYKHARCPKNYKQGNSLVCDFTYDKCEAQGSLGWVLEGESLDIKYGPEHDHTSMLRDRFGAMYSNNLYARTNFLLKDKPSLTYIMERGPWEAGTQLCLSFWYMMHGRDQARLELRVQGVMGEEFSEADESSEEEQEQEELFVSLHSDATDSPALWSRDVGVLIPKWMHGQHVLNLTEEDIDQQALQVIFKAHKGIGYRSRIALDDIFLQEGACYEDDDVSCNFERDTCGWVPHPLDRDVWSLEIGEQENTTLTGDHSSINGSGYYLQKQPSEEHATIVSPRLGNNYGPHCLTFWYYISSYNIEEPITTTFSPIETTTDFEQTTDDSIDHELGISVRKWNENAWNNLLESELQTMDNWTMARVDVPKMTGPIRMQIVVNTRTLAAIDEINWFDSECDDLYVYTCGPNEFQCSDGLQCIPEREMCDGREQCNDGSDEDKDIACPDECTNRQFQCRALQYCISDVYRCNNKNDCGDSSDELGCSNSLSLRPILLVAVVIGTIAVFALVVAIITMCIYKRRYKRQQRYRERMLQAIQDNVQPLPTTPPEYWDTVQGGGTDGTLRVPPPYDVNPPTYEDDQARQTTEGVECECRAEDPVPYDEISLAGNRVTEGGRHTSSHMPDLIPASASGGRDNLPFHSNTSLPPNRPAGGGVPLTRMQALRASTSSMQADNGSAIVDEKPSTNEKGGDFIPANQKARNGGPSANDEADSTARQSDEKPIDLAMVASDTDGDGEVSVHHESEAEIPLEKALAGSENVQLPQELGNLEDVVGAPLENGYTETDSSAAGTNNEARGVTYDNLAYDDDAPTAADDRREQRGVVYDNLAYDDNELSSSDSESHEKS